MLRDALFYYVLWNINEYSMKQLISTIKKSIVAKIKSVTREHLIMQY